MRQSTRHAICSRLKGLDEVHSNELTGCDVEVNEVKARGKVRLQRKYDRIIVLSRFWITSKAQETLNYILETDLKGKDEGEDRDKWLELHFYFARGEK